MKISKDDMQNCEASNIKKKIGVKFQFYPGPKKISKVFRAFLKFVEICRCVLSNFTSGDITKNPPKLVQNIITK